MPCYSCHIPPSFRRPDHLCWTQGRQPQTICIHCKQHGQYASHSLLQSLAEDVSIVCGNSACCHKLSRVRKKEAKFSCQVALNTSISAAVSVYCIWLWGLLLNSLMPGPDCCSNFENCQWFGRQRGKSGPSKCASSCSKAGRGWHQQSCCPVVIWQSESRHLIHSCTLQSDHAVAPDDLHWGPAAMYTPCQCFAVVTYPP